MKLVFLGTPAVAVPALKALAAAGHEIALVVTRPDLPRGRSGRPVPPPVKVAATELGIEVHQPARTRNRAFAEELGAREPELLVVVAYGHILTERVLGLAPAGAVNVHFSLLPAYRGAAPVQWALANGERVTGVTTMQIAEELDAGDILMQREVAVAPGERAPALQERLAAIGADLLVATLQGLRAGTLESREQDHGRATLAPRLTAADGEIDPLLDAGEIEGRVRGFDPWPGVWVRGGDRRLRLVEVADTGRSDPQSVPGQVMGLEKDGLLVACGGGTLLRVTRIQPEGRRILSARDAVNGRVIRPGDRLERLAPAP